MIYHIRADVTGSLYDISSQATGSRCGSMLGTLAFQAQLPSARLGNAASFLTCSNSNTVAINPVGHCPVGYNRLVGFRSW